MGYYRAPEGKEVRNGVGFGQDGSRSYEERQRVPGDYDAPKSVIHSGMARHGLEHLASTDRGIIMMRNMIRHGIRAVRDGGELDTPMLRGEAVPVPTYGQDRVVSGVAPPRHRRRTANWCARSPAMSSRKRWQPAFPVKTSPIRFDHPSNLS